jgi:hypothetical protein
MLTFFCLRPFQDFETTARVKLELFNLHLEDLFCFLGDNSVTPRALVTATEVKPGKTKPDSQDSSKPQPGQPTPKQPPAASKPPKDAPKGSKGSGSSSDDDKKKSSDEEKPSKNVKAETKNGNGKKAVKIDAPPTNKKPPEPPPKANGNPKGPKQPSTKAGEVKQQPNGKGKVDQKPSQEKEESSLKSPSQEVTPQLQDKKFDFAGLQTSIMDGEEWKVIISSKHELETISDFPNNKTVMITPKVVVKEADKIEKKKEKVSLFYTTLGIHILLQP